MAVVTLRKMLENGVHFGHQTRKWDPNMKPYIYTAKNNVYIIDLNKTQEQLEVAYNALKKITEDGGKVLFVGTKKQAQATILEEAIRCGSFYVNQRWLGGTLTNFRTIQKSIKTLVDIEEMEANGTLALYTKKEQAMKLIYELLSDGREVSVAELNKEAIERGISERTVRMVRNSMKEKLESERRGKDWWIWLKRQNETANSL